jgi:hypothetical protein
MLDNFKDSVQALVAKLVATPYVYTQPIMSTLTSTLCRVTEDPKSTLTAEQRCAVQDQPWKQWLEAEMSQSDSDADSVDEEKRPWLTWKPNLQDPSDKPWLHWGDGLSKSAADGPEMNGAYPSVDLSRF